MQRNEVPESDVEDDINRLSVFKHQGQPIGTVSLQMLTDPEYKAAMKTYVY